MLLASAALLVALAPGPGSRVRTADALTCGVDMACYTLTVSLFGNGSGSWKSTDSSFVPDGKIDCEYLDGSVVAGSTCSHKYADLSFGYVTVDFLVTAAAGSTVCWPTVADCGLREDIENVIFNSDYTSSDHGFLLNTETIGVTRTGIGTGTVTSTPAGIACGTTCSAGFDYGSTVILKATPDAGAAFTSWTGACFGQGAMCSLSMTTDRSTNAVFGLQSATPPPTASPRPVSTPHPTPTTTSSGSKSPAPGASGPGQPTPGSSPGSGLASPGSVDVSAAPGTSAGSGPGVPAVSTGTPLDLTPVVLSILGAGLLVAIGIAVGAFILKRKARSG
jgi:hypothetical protein